MNSQFAGTYNGQYTHVSIRIDVGTGVFNAKINNQLVISKASVAKPSRVAGGIRYVALRSGFGNVPLSNAHSFVDDLRISSLTSSGTAIPCSGVFGANINGVPDQHEVTVVLIHGAQPGRYSGDPPNWIREMRQSLIDRGINVITFTWPEAYNLQTVLVPNVLENAATCQGAVLARYLSNNRELIDQDFLIHFIPHSLGTIVGARGAAGVANDSRAKIQFTLLDAPIDAPLNWPIVDQDWFRAVLRPTAGFAFVDNYYGTARGAMGEPIDGAFNRAIPTGHSGVHEWYQETIDNPLAEEGFYWSLAGGGFDLRPQPRCWLDECDEPLTETERRYNQKLWMSG